MTSVDELDRRLQALLPLSEESVDAFEDLVGELHEDGSLDAARVLVGILHDECELEGLMQHVTSTLAAFPPGTLVQSFVDSLPPLAARAPAAARDLVRTVLVSSDCRSELERHIPKLSGDARGALRLLLERVGRFERYSAVVQTLLPLVE